MLLIFVSQGSPHWSVRGARVRGARVPRNIHTWKSLPLPFTLAISLLALHWPLYEALQPVEALSTRSRSRFQPWPSLTSHQFYVHTFPQGSRRRPSRSNAKSSKCRSLPQVIISFPISGLLLCPSPPAAGARPSGPRQPTTCTYHLSSVFGIVWHRMLSAMRQISDRPFFSASIRSIGYQSIAREMYTHPIEMEMEMVSD